MLLNPALFIIPIIISLIACFDLMNQVSVLNELNYFDTQVKESFADYMVYIYGGMDRYVPKSGNNFLFPIRWLVVFMISPFLVLNYPYRDMQGIGQQILVRTRGRTAWWMSKCIWNVLSVFIYNFLLFATALFFCIAVGGDISGGINSELQYIAFQFDRSSMIYGDEPWSLAIIFLPVLVSISINLMQMTLSLFIKPVFSFFFVAFLLISSAYFTSPYLLGNYAMSMRYDMVVKDGVSVADGTIMALLLIGVSICIGVVRFHRYDILDRD